MKKLLSFLFFLIFTLTNAQDGRYVFPRYNPNTVTTANYTLSPNDFVPCDVTTGSFTLTLPTAPLDKTILGAKIISTTTANIIVVKTGGSDVFNKTGGATSGTITLPGQAMNFQYKASMGIWYVIASDMPLNQLDSRYASNGVEWLTSGNTLGSNSLFLGSTDNRSLVVKTATATNTGYLKYDSIGSFIWKQPSTVAQNNFQISRWINSGLDYPAFYLGVANPTAYNYFGSCDSLITFINAPKTMILRTNNSTFMTAATTQTTASSAVTFGAINQSTVNANAEIRHFTWTGSNIGWNTGTVGTQRKILLSGDTYSANSTASITNAISLQVNKPVQGTNMTITNLWAGEFVGDLNVSARLSLGSALTVPNATLTVIGTESVSGTSTLGGVLTSNGITNTGSISATTQGSFGTTFTVTGISKLTGGILGTTTNDDATAGNQGEFSSVLVALASAVSFTTATAMNICTLSLTAGDWDVSANINVNETTATVSDRVGGVTSTSATIPVDGSEVYCGVQSVVVTEKNSLSIPRKRFSLSATTTIYLVGKCTFSAGTATGYGSMTARRIR